MTQLNPLLHRSDMQKSLTVPNAYLAWAHWVNLQNVGGLQVAAVHAAFNGRVSPDDERARLVALCEVYARAIFETALAIHFDECDSMSDVQVATHIALHFSDDLAVSVHRACRAHGPTVRDAAAMFGPIAEETEETEAAASLGLEPLRLRSR
jgi:hypothetical protein